MTTLDTTVVNVAIEGLSRDFDASLSTIQWVATGYMLALATVIPVSGWAADRFGTKRLFMLSLALFLAGSALSGLAWSAGSLIGFRIVQGLGGGMIMPAGITILTHAAGRERAGRAMTILGVPMMLGPILGPTLGGWLVDDISWRWIFLVNLPVGAVALAAALRHLPADEPQPHQRLDWLGLALLSPGLAAFVYGLAETTSDGGVGSTRALVPVAAGIALIAGFALRSLRTGHPLIDLRLLRARAVAASALTVFTSAAAFYGAMLLFPLYFQTVRGESALTAGLLLVPFGVGAAMTMPVAGRLTDRIGAGWVVPAGHAVALAGLLVFAQVDGGTSYWLLGGALLLFGMGLGATVMPAMSAAYRTLPRAAVARATTALNIMMRTGSSIGTALLAVVLQHGLDGEVDRAGAFADAYWWGVALIGVAIVAALLLPRRGTEPAAVAGATGQPRP